MELRFLGQSYTQARPIKTFKPQLGLRKYRGVSYIELSFLGESSPLSNKSKSINSRSLNKLLTPTAKEN
ncbi:MAG: hypothetical protein QNJ32_20390 [Xenococcaceae cyanobacterium MO_167.B27]|nr:hypothetical protein [Xenococcaceae cyanobacterium MO_167.B27]